VWKRGPRADDTDKGNTFKRMFFNNEAYKRRYFVLDTVKLELKYYADYSRGTELGCIDLLAVITVSYENNSGEELPYKYPWSLITDYREWSLCCENEEDYKAWKREIANIIKRREEGTSSDATLSKVPMDARDGMCLESPPMMIQRSMVDETEYKGNPRHSHSGKTLFRKLATANNNSHKKMNSFSFRRRSCFQNGSYRSEVLHLQRARLGEESVYNSYTGNVGIAATATFSRYEMLENLNFFQVLMSSCQDDVEVISRHHVVTKFLSDCQFEFFSKEGEVLVSEGSKFEWVYFVLLGEIEQRKNWASSTNRIDEKISVGECAGFVEVLHFNGISTKTLMVNPGTICLKINVNLFRKQFKDKAKFSSGMDPSNTLYTERLLTFTHKCLANLPLLQRQPIGNIQALSYIFSSVFIASGDHLMDVGETSDNFYIIIEGSCSVFQKSSLDADEADEIVRSCRAGDWVGEAGLINIQARHITVVAYSDVVALRTDAAGFKRFMDITGPSVREAITKSTTTYLSGVLKTIPLFTNIDESQILDISREIEIQELERNALLFNAGDIIEDLYIILHGYVKCAIREVSGLDLSASPPFIDTMRENDFFGESAVLFDTSPTRVQYFTPDDVKVVVLRISANKLKAFLPGCPILQLRFEERLMVRKNHMDLIDTLINSISISMSSRYEAHSSGRSIGNSTGRSRAKQSLGHIADMKAKETSTMNDEVLYLREEVRRLNGVQYVDTVKGRSNSRPKSTFKSTFQRLKSSLPISSSPTIETKHKMSKNSFRHISKEAEFELAGKEVFRDEENSVTDTNASLFSNQSAENSVTHLESLASVDFIPGTPRAVNENKFGYSDSDSNQDEESDISIADNEYSSSDESSNGSGTDGSKDLIPQLTSKRRKAAIHALSMSDDNDDDTPPKSKQTRRKNLNKILNREKNEEGRDSVHEIDLDLDLDLDDHLNFDSTPPSLNDKTGRKSPLPVKQSSTSPTRKEPTKGPMKSSKYNKTQSKSKSKSPIKTESSDAPYVVDAMYARMMKMKLPEAAIRKKMTSDGVPVEAIDNFFRNNVGL